MNIRQIRKRHDKEIEEFQDLCKHKMYDTMPYVWAPGHITGDVKVCVRCGKILEHLPLSQSEWTTTTTATNYGVLSSQVT